MSIVSPEAIFDADPPCDAPAHEAESLLRRIRAEFAEMPGLNLTLSQAARLWHAERRCVGAALNRLLRDGFLVRTAKGVYRREPCPRCA
jgi:hypothetical protein